MCGDTGNKREIGHREEQGIASILDKSESLVTHPSLWKVNALGNGLGETEDGIIFPGQCQSKERKRRRKGSTTTSAPPSPHQCDSGISSVCTGLDVMWNLPWLRRYPRLSAVWLCSSIRVRSPWKGPFQGCLPPTMFPEYPVTMLQSMTL